MIQWKNILSNPIWLIGCAGITTIWIYTQGFHGAFIYDDYSQILFNEKLHQISNWKDVIFCDIRQNRVWQNISLAINWAITPKSTLSFKIFNLLFHLLNSTIFYLWLKRILNQKVIAAIATAIFLIHPLQIQSVTYVMAATTLFQGFFYLFPLYWMAKYGYQRFWVVILTLFLSIFAKETCTLIPVVLYLQERFIKQTPFKSMPREKWAILFFISFLYFPMYYLIKDPVSMYSGTVGFELYPFWRYGAAQLFYQTFYAILFFRADQQTLIHGLPPLNGSTLPHMLTGAVIWLGGAYLILFKWKKYPKFAFFLAFFFITYLPTSTLFQMINPFAEYRLYLPTGILCVGFATLIYQMHLWIEKNTGYRLAYTTLTLFFIWIFAQGTLEHVRLWNNANDVYMQSITIYPRDPTIRSSLANVYFGEQQYEKALEMYYADWQLRGKLTFHLSQQLMNTAIKLEETGKWELALSVLDRVYEAKDREPLPPIFHKVHKIMKWKYKNKNKVTKPKTAR